MSVVTSRRNSTGVLSSGKKFECVENGVYGMMFSAKTSSHTHHFLHTQKLIMHSFVLPLACGGDGLLQGRDQVIKVIDVVTVDCPGFGFLSWLRRPAIDADADAGPVFEKLFLDAGHVFPAYLDGLAPPVLLDDLVRFQAQNKRYRDD